MTTWKIIQIYRVPAQTKREALVRFHREPEAYFVTVFAVEDIQQPFWKQMVKSTIDQLLG